MKELQINTELIMLEKVSLVHPHCDINQSITLISHLSLARALRVWGRGGGGEVLDCLHIEDWEKGPGRKEGRTGMEEGISGSAPSRSRHSLADCTSWSLLDLPGRGPEAREGGQPILVSYSFIFLLRNSNSWSCRSPQNAC